MSAFLRKLRYLLIFVLFYFLVCRIQELLSLPESWDWSGVVDPFKVRVRALKAVLVRRGISTDSGLERQDLVQMVRSSGRLTDVEVIQVTENNQSFPSASKEVDLKAEEGAENDVTAFSNLAHFDELVEDCKDSAWLVEIRQQGRPVVPKETWNRLIRHLRHFDIRIGRVDCSERTILCSRKAFHRSGLLLAMPKGRSRQKDSVVFSWFTRQPELPRILAWLQSALATRVPKLDGGLEALARLSNASGSQVGDFLLALDATRLPQVPLLFSALSVRFTGRVRFWRVGAAQARLLTHRPTGPSSFFLLGGPGRPPYEYGARKDRSEPTTFRALELFLRTNFPEANDTLIGLSYPVCMLALLALAVGSRGPLLRLISCLASLVGYGLLFLLLYLPLEQLLSMRSLQGFRAALLALCQVLARSELGAILRRDCLADRFATSRIAVWFGLFLVAVALYESRRAAEENEEESVTPDADAERSVPRPYIPEQAQMEHMVNYLYSSLWLPPDDWAKDYLEALPVWYYPLEAGGVSDEETVVGSSADESSEWPSGVVLTRQCSVCLCSFRKGTALCSLPCGHVFHESCVKRWLQHPERDSCPNCRWPAFKGK